MTLSAQRPTIMLWGAGSQARLIDGMITDLDLGSTKLIFDPLTEKTFFKGDDRFTGDYEQAALFVKNISHFVVCIGNYAGYARSQTSEQLRKMDLEPLSVIHQTAIIDHSVALGMGLQVMPGAIIQKFTYVDDWTILNTGAVVDHECRIGKGVHVMGGAAIAGRVIIEDFVTVGTNATILPDLRIGAGAIIGAGAVVTADVNSGEVVAGVPARFKRINEQQDPANLLLKFQLACH